MAVSQLSLEVVEVAEGGNFFNVGEVLYCWRGKGERELERWKCRGDGEKTSDIWSVLELADLE